MTISTTITSSLRHLAGSRPEDVFCTFQRAGTLEDITYGRLCAKAATYTKLFRETGLGAGDIVLIILPYQPAMLDVFVGAVIAGCLPAFLSPQTDKQDPSVYRTTLQQLFRHTQARAAVVPSDKIEEMRQVAGGDTRLVFYCPQSEVMPLRGVDWPTIVEPDDAAFLQFSSGTTGLRKGVTLTHRIVMEQIRTYADALCLDPTKDHIASWLPLYHDMGLIACFLLPLLTGTRLSLLDPMEWVNDPSLLFDTITRQRTTLIWMPNFAFDHLVLATDRSRSYDLSSVRAFIDCSEPCKSSTLRRFVNAFVNIGVKAEQLAVCYAMAEAVFAVTQTDLGEGLTVLRVDEAQLSAGRVVPSTAANASEILSVGRVLPGFEVRIVSSDGEDQPTDHVGEIALRGVSVFPGYHRSPDATGSAFVDGWFRTGDLGFRQGDRIFVTGRIKDLIIVNGRNIYSHDVEAVLNQISGIKPGRVVAFGHFNDNLGTEEVVVVAESTVVDPEEQRKLKRTMRSRLLDHLSVSAVVALVEPKWLIKTSSGKISRLQNAGKYLDSLKSASTSDARL